MIGSVVAVAVFNLICTVQGTYFDKKQQDGGSFPVEYRIDLAEGRFCVGTCDETHPIAKATATDFYLVAKSYEDGSNKEFIKINRESGSYVWILGAPPSEVRLIGECEKRPFSGFPQRKF